jgi:hypothetical protein
MLLDQFSKPQVLVQFSDQNQTPVGSHPRPLEIHFQKPVETELKRLVLLFTHWVYILRT